MGIYIHGMEMPSKGKCKQVTFFDDGVVCDGALIVGKAIELPPHGRLIDADALAAKDDADYEDAMECIADVSSRSVVCQIHYAAQKMIAEADTIIPADPEKEDT